jgi:hypothetical protein
MVSEADKKRLKEELVNKRILKFFEGQGDFWGEWVIYTS